MFKYLMLQCSYCPVQFTKKKLLSCTYFWSHYEPGVKWYFYECLNGQTKRNSTHGIKTKPMARPGLEQNIIL